LRDCFIALYIGVYSELSLRINVKRVVSCKHPTHNAQDVVHVTIPILFFFEFPTLLPFALVLGLSFLRFILGSSFILVVTALLFILLCEFRSLDT